MTDPIRAFVAIDLPGEIERALASVQRELRDTGARASWSLPGQLHVTLRFLGDLEPQAVEAVRRELAAALAPVVGFELAFAGLGYFGRKGAPRVVWAGCGDGSVALRELAARVEGAARAAGFPPDRQGFTAHVTLARVVRSTPALLKEIAAHPDRPFGRQRVAEVVLYRSEITGDGSRYGVLARYPLGA